MEFGFMSELRGFGVLHLRRPPAVTDGELRAAVEKAAEWAEKRGLYGLLLSVPGSGSFLAGTGFEVSGRPARFEPRLVNLDSGEIFRLPHFGKTRYVHTGDVWLRENRRKRMKYLTGPWVPLGFALDLDATCEEVYVRPAPGVRVNGELIETSVQIVDQDTVSHGDATLTYFREPPGRPLLANYFTKYTGMGWEQPGFTRAVRLFRRT